MVVGCPEGLDQDRAFFGFQMGWITGNRVTKLKLKPKPCVHALHHHISCTNLHNLFVFLFSKLKETQNYDTEGSDLTEHFLYDMIIRHNTIWN